jgi:hypothetical protein
LLGKNGGNYRRLISRMRRTRQIAACIECEKERHGQPFICHFREDIELANVSNGKSPPVLLTSDLLSLAAVSAPAVNERKR